MSDKRRGNKFKMVQTAAVNDSNGVGPTTGAAAPEPTFRSERWTA
jgi:hypothetical protein